MPITKVPEVTCSDISILIFFYCSAPLLCQYKFFIQCIMLVSFLIFKYFQQVPKHFYLLIYISLIFVPTLHRFWLILSDRNAEHDFCIAIFSSSSFTLITFHISSIRSLLWWKDSWFGSNSFIYRHILCDANVDRNFFWDSLIGLFVKLSSLPLLLDAFFL